MSDNNLHHSFWDQPRITPHVTEQMQNFLDASAHLSFETRYIGEEQWWPIFNNEVAYTLGCYYDDLPLSLAKMLNGEVVRSPVAEFRAAKRTAQATPTPLVAA